jgi:hypothetical protein
LVKGIQEQQAQISDLEARVTALEEGKLGGVPRGFWGKVWDFITLKWID